MTQGKTADRVRGQRAGPPWPREAGCAVEDFRVRVLALAAELRPLRHALTDWARRTPLRPEQVDSLQLASDEAAANVVEHAYSAGRSGVLRLEATCRLDPGLVTVTVTDQGRWRPP